jgi:hypothetical protein
MPALPIQRSGPRDERVDGGTTLIRDLERAGVLTSHQSARLLSLWPHLDDEWWADPYFRTVREHSRAYINQLRLSQSTINHSKEMIPHV